MRITLLLILIVSTCCQSLAQGPVHSFNHISRKDGLASNNVYDIIQDEKGFFWIATDNGLQRYDGRWWVNPYYDDLNSIPPKPVHQAVINNRYELILRLGRNLGLFNTSNFKFSRLRVDVPEAWNKEPVLWQNKRGEIFLLYRGAGLLKFNPETNRFSQDELPFQLPADIRPNSIFEDTVTCRYWIATDAGVYVFDQIKKEMYHGRFNPQNLPFISGEQYKNVTSIFIDHKRVHWIVYGEVNQHYDAYDEAEARPVSEARKLADFYTGKFRIENLYQTREKELWLFGRSALFNYIPEKKRFYNNKSDLIRNMGAKFSQVRRIMQDRELGIWIATDEGLYQFYTVLPDVRNTVFQTTFDDNNITDVQEITNGEMWLSSRGKGIIPMDSTNKTYRKNFYRSIDTVKFRSAKMANTILQHSRTGMVYVGCDDGILLKVNPLDSSLKMLQPRSLGGNNIHDIVEDGEGRLFLGTASGDVVSYNYKNDSLLVVHSVKGRVNKLMIDAAQRLWIASAENGVSVYDPRSNKALYHFSHDGTPSAALSSNQVRSIVQLNDTIYAVATDVFELLNIRTGKAQVITSAEGLLGNTILGMQKDHQGYLWLATSNGVCRYNHTRKKFTVFGEKDGFMNYETVGISSAMFRNGRIFFGSGNSFVTFPPHLFNVPETPPEVVFTDIKVLNTFIPLDSSSLNLELTHDNNSISFYFSAMTYLHKDKLTYFYRLRGVDEDWVMADKQHSAIYTLLPPGKFTFEVRCENEDGISSPATMYTFRINPPFWRTWWFVMIALLFVAAVLYLFHRSRMNRVIALSDLRNRVARDLHDDVGSTLSTISILSTIAKGKLIDNPSQAEQYISKISDNSQQMMDAMDDIVWSIKPMNDSMQKIVARMREFASGVLEPRNMEVEFIVDERVLEIKLNMESRRDLFLVFKEAINNIAKYSGASRVTIHVSHLRQRLLLRIKDDGQGFDVDKADSGNGLSNMKKRAAMMHGRIRIVSQRGRGTMVLLNIPVNT